MSFTEHSSYNFCCLPSTAYGGFLSFLLLQWFSTLYLPPGPSTIENDAHGIEKLLVKTQVSEKFLHNGGIFLIQYFISSSKDLCPHHVLKILAIVNQNIDTSIEIIECQTLYSQLKLNNKIISLHWIQGLWGIEGNENATPWRKRIKHYITQCHIRPTSFFLAKSHVHKSTRNNAQYRLLLRILGEIMEGFF